MKMPREMEHLMGQANKEYLVGGHEKAIEICERVIQEHPEFYQPYETLSEIYIDYAKKLGGAKNHTEKELKELSVECKYFGALMKFDTPAKTWEFIGDEFLNINKHPRAISCFKKAFKMTKKDMNLAKKLQQLICDFSTSEEKVLESYEIIITAMADSHDACKLAYNKAMKAHENNFLEVSVNLLKKAMNVHRSAFGIECLHRLCELCMIAKKYKDILKSLDFMEMIKLSYFAEDQTTEISEAEARRLRRNDVENISSIQVHNVNIDLQSQAVLSAIHCNHTALVQDAVERIFLLDSAVVGDVQFGFAEACFEAGQFEESLRLVELLSVHEAFANNQSLFKLKGMSLLKLKEYQEAKDNFFKCLQISAEDSVDIRMELAAILLDTGEYRVAIETLDGADEGEENEITAKDRMRLLMRRFEVFKKWGQLPNKKKKLAAAADVVLIMFANRLKNTFKTELSIVQRTKKSTNPFAGEIKLTCKRLGKQRIDEELYLKADWTAYKQTTWINLYKDLLCLLNTCKRYKEAVLINDQIMKEKHFFARSRVRRTKLEVFSFRFSLLSGWYSYAFRLLKNMILAKKEDPASIPNHVWNIFNQVVTRLSHSHRALISTHKFINRVMALEKGKHHVKKIFPLQSMFAHGNIATSKFRWALTYYIELLEEEPENAQLHLVVGVCYCHILTQKTCGNKHTYVAQAFALLSKYCQLRNNKQESMYNIGRAFQQIGLNHFAVHMYEDALKLPPPRVHGAVCEESFDLKHEIVFNLSLIYRQSGNHKLADYVLFEHNVI